MADNDKQNPSTKETHGVSDYFPDEAFHSELDFIFKKHTIANERLQELAAVFSESVVATVLTASAMPVFSRRAAHHSGYMTMWGISYTAQLIRDPNEAREKTKGALEKELKDGWDEKLSAHVTETAKMFLQEFISDNFGRDAIRQIMNQCSVLAWCSFEVLASDVFRYLLNKRPQYTKSLLKDAVTKNYYREKDIASALEEYNYNLSERMGDILIEQKRLDDLAAIKSVYRVLLKSISFQNESNSALLWRLYKVRNLVVHRAAVVDAIFKKETGDTNPIGTKLRVTPRDLIDFVSIVRKTGIELLTAADDLMREESHVSSLQMNLTGPS